MSKRKDFSLFCAFLLLSTMMFSGIALGQKVDETSPSKRSGYVIAFDSKHKRVILYGGVDTNNNLLADTWSWNGKRWTQLKIEGPGPRLDSQMTFDSKRGCVVLFGGLGETARMGDTWELCGNTWKLVKNDGPPARNLGAMTFDSGRKRVVLFGGRDTQRKALGDTWEWDGKNWQEFKANAPEARAEHDGIYFPNKGYLIFGGIIGQELDEDKRERANDTWLWNGQRWLNYSNKLGN